MDKAGNILHIEEHDDYQYAIDPATIRNQGIFVIGPLSVHILRWAGIVSDTGEPFQMEYSFTHQNTTHHRLVHIRPTTSSHWRAQGATIEITQHRLAPG